jgi:N4-(beta-N-acetylglucosaminyl)-L-asparaginase
MTTRKNFIRHGLLAAAALGLGKARAFVPPFQSNTPVKNIKRPVVISTWEMGLKANKVAWDVLVKEGTALDAVEAGVRVVEADPTERSVGYGGRPDRNGHVTLDACIMDEHANIGAVAFLEHIKHPVSVARAVMEQSPHVMLVGEGALQFALEQGFRKENLLTPESELEWKEWLKVSQYKPAINVENHDTIGILALDMHGNLSGACSTSGMPFKMHGRVGDSPIIGAGLYIDNEVGGAAATGHGEEMIRIAGSHYVVELMRQGLSPEAACKEAVKRILLSQRKRGKSPMDIQVGFIALSKSGAYGAYCLQDGFEYALYTPDVNNQVYCAAKLIR